MQKRRANIAPPPAKFWAVENSKENLVVGKFLSENAKFEIETFPFGGNFRPNLK